MDSGPEPESSLEGIPEFRLLTAADLLVEWRVGSPGPADQSQNDHQSVDSKKIIFVKLLLMKL